MIVNHETALCKILSLLYSVARDWDFFGKEMFFFCWSKSTRSFCIRQ